MKTRQTRFLLTSTFTKSDLTYKYWKSLEYSKSPDEFLIPFWFSQLSIRKCKTIHSKTWKYFIFSLICLTEWYLVCSIVSAQLYWHPMIQNIDIPPPEDNQHQQRFWFTYQSNSLCSEWIPQILAMGPHHPNFCGCVGTFFNILTVITSSQIPCVCQPFWKTLS